MKSMKIFVVSFVLVVLVMSSCASAELPKTYKEFKARYQTEAKTYQGAIKLYFEAVFAYINKDTREEGGKMLRYALRSETPIDRSTYYATFADRLKDPSCTHIFRSYAKGTSPENDYAMSPDDFEINYTGKVEDARDYLRVFLRSSGADSPRAIWVKEFDGGLWFVINNASTYVEVKQPKSEIDRRNRAFDADYDE
ncbi:MAG: hypothetical protein IJU48_03015 [Synergistaceae bacterium]|nr:hypothetical protein [Synergistaceae bacterium]